MERQLEPQGARSARGWKPEAHATWRVAPQQTLSAPGPAVKVPVYLVENTHGSPNQRKRPRAPHGYDFSPPHQAQDGGAPERVQHCNDRMRQGRSRKTRKTDQVLEVCTKAGKRFGWKKKANK